jgi:hypothetical protein
LHIVIPSELAVGIILRMHRCGFMKTRGCGLLPEDGQTQGKKSLLPAHDALMKAVGENAL